ncbi:MAG: hypothetical protein HUJ31_17040, partial [Pseudomonadales bacterium]|nr:hypothetical protein [Pseudomonadales bacterium]
MMGRHYSGEKDAVTGPKVAVIEGDDASPEAVRPVVDLIAGLVPEIEWQYPVVGEGAREQTGSPFPDESRDIIDKCDTTLFGATSTSSAIALFYLRWGKQTYANVRPTRFLKGYRSSLVNPGGVDFLIVRENLE